MLIAFRPAGSTRHRALRSPLEGTDQSVLVAIEGDGPATLARLRRWEASDATVVMWRDRADNRVELSHLRTSQQVRLSVIPQAATVALGAVTARP